MVVNAHAQVNGLGPSDPALFTTVINVPPDIVEGSIGGVLGETTQMNLTEGGFLRRLDANVGTEVNVGGGFAIGIDSINEVNISGGEISSLEAKSGSHVNVAGGIVTRLNAFSGSEVSFSGGIVQIELVASPGSLVNVSGGTVVRLLARGEVNISGGTVDVNSSIVGALSTGEVNISGGNVDIGRLSPGAELNISGGNVEAGGPRADSGSVVNLFGTEFTLNGSLLEDLVEGEEFEITVRDVSLSGLLTDGARFDFLLNDDFRPSGIGPYFSPDATLTVTLVPEPESLQTTLMAALLLWRLQNSRRQNA